MFQPEGFSLTIFKDRYAFTPEESWSVASLRVARQMAMAEAPAEQFEYENKFYHILSENLFMPGGRIWYNSGRINPQLLNCFVLGNKLDSKEGWGNLAREMIVTSMTGGGCGIDFSDVRPDNAPIAGHRGTCSGPVSLMSLIDNAANPIRMGGSRRVALMFSLLLNHPNIIQFINEKLENGKLTNANVSVRSENTTSFIKAIENDEEWELSWKGKYKTSVKARTLWDKIVNNAYNSAEPGFLNWELVLSESTISYIEDLVTTNPCGEIALSAYDCCCLGHLVLPKFVTNGKLQWAKLAHVVRLGVRFLDNVLSVNHYPLIEMQNKSHQLRRIGLGTTGLADMLAMMGIKYGSTDGEEFIDRLYKFISEASYVASIRLAKEKGAFPACDPIKHVETGFVKRFPDFIKKGILKHGVRNCAMLTQAPTGTISIVSDNCSSGIEPMFSPGYYRNYFDKNERKRELVFHPLFAKFMEEGRDTSHFVGSRDLTVEQHMRVQMIVQRHADNAVSKTINVPADYPVEDMAATWLKYLPFLKGTTFYRENTRGFVQADGTLAEPPLVAISLEQAVELYNTNSKREAAETNDCPSGVCGI
jgi:ribonucleoside-diphosphate reductase alpha chain